MGSLRLPAVPRVGSTGARPGAPHPRDVLAARAVGLFFAGCAVVNAVGTRPHATEVFAWFRDGSWLPPYRWALGRLVPYARPAVAATVAFEGAVAALLVGRRHRRAGMWLATAWTAGVSPAVAWPYWLANVPQVALYAGLARRLGRTGGPPHGPAPVAEVAPGVHRMSSGRGALASNVYLVRSGGTSALVDTGWAGSAPAIRRVVEEHLGPGTHPDAVLLTHVHPDHSPAAGPLARAWGVPVYLHPDELPMAAGDYVPALANPLDRWVLGPLLALLPARVRARMAAAGSITDVVRPLPPDRSVPGLPGWQWVPAPGHTPGSTAFLRPGDGVLITGDAAVTVDLNSLRGLLTARRRPGAPPWYTTWDADRARSALAALADLEPRVLLPGHGDPLHAGAAEALRGLAGAPWPSPLRRLQAALAPTPRPALPPDRRGRRRRLLRRGSSRGPRATPSTR